jgi:hypothetical protein
MRLYGVAADDAHHYKSFPKDCNPGTSWIMVRAAELSVNSIREAISEGRFYATNGVILKSLTTKNGLYAIQADSAATLMELADRDKWRAVNTGRPVKGGIQGFSIDFLGVNGEVLKTVAGSAAGMQLTNDMPYLRPRITYTRSMAGRPYSKSLGQKQYIQKHGIKKEAYYAWGQPIFSDERRRETPLAFGCTDPEYMEYDPTANVHNPDDCRISGIAVKTSRIHSPKERIRIEFSVPPVFGDYNVRIITFDGEPLCMEKSRPDRRHTLDIHSDKGTCFLLIKGENNSYSKYIMAVS